MSTAQDVLNVARSQLGYVEGRGNRTKYGAWYGLDGNAWCDMFVSWCADQAGAADVIGKFAYTPSHYNWFKSREQAGTEPRVGAIVFFYYPSQRRIAHVGIVEEVRADGNFVTIEGNTDVAGGRTGGQVMRKVRSRVNAFFGYPAYSGVPTPAPVIAPAKPKPKAYPSRGSKGAEVARIQNNLNRHGFRVTVDSDFGPATHNAVVAFQRARGLEADGIVGPNTHAALNAEPPRPKPAPAPARPMVRKGSKGTHVSHLQQRLRAHGHRLSVDGDFGPGTHRSVVAFQKKHGLTQDGIVGPNTWKALG